MAESKRPQLDYERAKKILVSTFSEAEKSFHEKKPPVVSASVVKASDILFASATQSYREVLLGCFLARLVDPTKNIRLPYVNLGPDAFNARELDQRIINPFLHDRMIPSSKGPYLASFRRSVAFDQDTAKGLRDKQGYEALLNIISTIEKTKKDDDIKDMFRYLLYRFIILRDAANISVSKIHRLSLDQFETLIDRILHVPSGGLLPVLLAVAMFSTIKQCFNLKWEIDWQGINVSDRASGAGGDITIKQDGVIILAVEVTERPIDRSRVVSTFNTKISLHGIDDYLFFFSASVPTDGAREAAQQYFAQGHDVSFLQVKDWLINCLGTIGSKCRSTFTSEFVKLLEGPSVPASIKVAWNDRIKSLVSNPTEN